MSEVTVICCWTNESMYQDFANSLKAQTIPYELIGVDNRSNRAFTSCAAAYNSVIDQVRTKYVVYSHQDIVLTEPDMLAKFVSYLERTNRDDILGVAGTNFATREGYSNITHRENQTGRLVHGTTRFPEGGMLECDTLDECFFGGHAQHFKDCLFDEVLCDNWHLYAAEECLRTKSAHQPGRVYACDVALLHLSSGTISPAFRYGFYKLCRKYADTFPFIKTTSAGSRTDFLHAFPLFVYLWGHSAAGVILKKLGIYHAVKRFLRKER